MWVHSSPPQVQCTAWDPVMSLLAKVATRSTKPCLLMPCTCRPGLQRPSGGCVLHGPWKRVDRSCRMEAVALTVLSDCPVDIKQQTPVKLNVFHSSSWGRTGCIFCELKARSRELDLPQRNCWHLPQNVVVKVRKTSKFLLTFLSWYVISKWHPDHYRY